MADTHGGEETERAIFENRSVAIGFGIISIFEVAEHDDAGLGSVRCAVAVVFDEEDAHGR